MRVLILGSAGQVGNYLSEYLKSSNKVTTFDIVDSPNEDIRLDNSYLEECIKNSDFVHFLAFDVGGSRYLKKYQNTFDFIHNNISIMKNVFDKIHRYAKPFIFASSQMSSMTYSPYGVTKKIGELYSNSLEGLVVKFWNVYGVEHNMEKSHVITDLIHKGFKNKKIDLLTDGEEQREFLHADDCCRALKNLMNNYNKLDKSQNYHITSFESTKIIDIAKIIKENFKNIGFDVEIIPSQNKDAVQFDAKNQPDKYILNFWKPEVNLEDGIKDIFEQILKDYKLEK